MRYSNPSILERIAGRLLPKKAEVGFFQEIDPVNGVLKNSSTRLFQLFFALILWPHLKVAYSYLESREIVDVTEIGAIAVMFIFHCVLIIAPKQLKNVEVLNTFVSALTHKKSGLKEKEKPNGQV